MTDPFKITEPTLISFSGGRTSAYMLWRVLQSNSGLPADAVACFANTGKEDPATYQFIKDCQDCCSYQGQARACPMVDQDGTADTGHHRSQKAWEWEHIPF